MTRKVVGQCTFGDCPQAAFAGLPLCFMCAMMTGRFMHDLFKAERHMPAEESRLSDEQFWQLGDFVEDTGDMWPPRSEASSERAVVYYLMLSPVTVKIGTTTNLLQRIGSLRTELQYIVALEPGSFDVERERHAQFKAERRTVRREDFELSDALKRHIDSLAPQREEMLARALGQVDTRG